MSSKFGSLHFDYDGWFGGTKPFFFFLRKFDVLTFVDGAVLTTHLHRLIGPNSSRNVIDA